MAAKETAASYKMDFKYKVKDLENPDKFEERTFVLRDFFRQNGTYSKYLSSFDRYVYRTELNRKYDTEDDNSYNWPTEEVVRKIWKDVDESESMKALNASFDKWLTRRQPVIDAWEEFVEYHSEQPERYYNNYPIGTPLTVTILADVHSRHKMRAILETSRPRKIVVGTPVRLMDKYKYNYRYDPFYWGEHSQKERVGVVVAYTGGCSAKAGLNSRYLEVMWFASGEKSKIPERGLEIHTSIPNTTVIPATENT